MKCDAIEKLKENLCTPLMTIIGRNGAGIPIERVEAIIEFDNEAAKEIFRRGIKENKVVKTLLNEDKIKSIVILDTGEIHPSTFHYTTLKNRCLPYVTMVTTIGGDAGGVNVDKINLILNYKVINQDNVVSELINKFQMTLCFDDTSRTKSLIIMDSKVVYPCTFNYATIRRRIHELRNDEEVPEETFDEDEYNETDYYDE